MQTNLIQLPYGEVQHFAFHTQRWINILGHVERPDAIGSLSASLNGAAPQRLTFRADLHRLANDGDFNAVFAREDLRDGENEVVIRADGYARTVTVVVNKAAAATLPVEIDFAAVTDVQEVGQVIDGNWALTGEGLRTMDPYYDRFVAFGDVTWTDYDARVEATLHGFTPSGSGPPTYGVTHFGLALRWQGHHADEHQPMRKWFPFGAQGEFLLQQDPGENRWRILFGMDRAAPPVYAEQPTLIRSGERFIARAQVRTVGPDVALYRFKIWPADEPEPEGWAVEGSKTGETRSGSFCIVPHHSDVTVHRLHIRPLGDAQ